MTDPSADAAFRARWYQFFSTMLPPQPELILAAAEAAVRAIDAGADQERAVASGMAAARGLTEAAEPRSAPRVARAGRPTAGPGATATKPSNAPTTAARERVWPAGSAVVHTVERRSETLDGIFFQVLSCRLVRLENGRTPAGPHIPVELRGRSIVGPISRGDVVMIPAGQGGRTRAVKTLRNLSTDSVIEAKGRPFRRTRTISRSARLGLHLFLSLVVLLVLLTVGLAAYLLLGDGSLQLPGR